MTAPRPLPWQQPHWRRLTEATQAQRLPHALLLAGPAGVGKRVFADALVGYMLCEQRSDAGACGHCRGCLQLAAGSHPNRMRLAPEEGKRDIGVDAVREVLARVSVSSHYGAAKLVLVDPADQLTMAAVNALLKTLEEPPPATFFLMVSERPRLLPATLRSRAQLLRFATPPQAQVLPWLGRYAPQVDAAALAEAGGAPLRALAWHDSGLLARRREWAGLLEEVAARRRSPLAAAASIGRYEAAAFCEWLLDWSVRGLRAAIAGETARAAPVYEQLAREAIDGLRALAANANAQLCVESIMMRWLGLAARGARNPAMPAR